MSLLVVPFEIRDIPAQNGWEDSSPETETTAQARWGGNSHVSVVRLSSDLALSFFFVGGSGRDLKNRKRHRPLDLDHDDGEGDARGKGKNRAVNGDGLFNLILSLFIDLPHGG